MIFPIRMTWAQIAIQPFAAECFSWDDSMLDPDDDDTTLISTIEDYSTAYHSSTKLADYLTSIGYTADVSGVVILNEAALRTADALFNQISSEYDDPEIDRVMTERHGHEWSTTPTWAMFELGGDDDTDYCGGQPSCLTDLLLRLVNLGKEAL